MVPIYRCIFQNKKTKKYKWLSFEGEGNSRVIYESKTDTADPPSQRPLDASAASGKLPDYENAKQRILDFGYDIVTQV